MSKSYTIHFLKDEWLPVTRDGIDYRVSYSYVPTSLVGQPEEKSNTSYASIVVGISRTLEAIWNLSKDNLRKILFEYAKRHINARAVEKTLGGKSEIQLTTYSAPNQCPFDPDLINIDLKNPMQVNIPSENPIAKSEPASLASQIIDLRDSINAIFGEVAGGCILALPQERHLVELFKDCNDHEAFAYRVASIGGLATAINSSDLKKYVKFELQEPKPLDVLGAFLRNNHFSEDKVNTIMDTLKNFNNLRRMYPVHTDRADGVLSAHRFFKLEYPVKDHAAAGIILLTTYRDTLEMLLELLKLWHEDKNG